ncbi:MAG: uracil-DNA glycosylase family protein [Ktedonobacterales bacterium]
MTTRTRATTISSLIPMPAPLPVADHYAERVRQLAALHAGMMACQHCVVAGYLPRAAAVAGYRGRIGDRLLLVGQAPGRLSVEHGEPFSGPGGRVLERWLDQAGFSLGALRREVYLSALTKCDPGRSPRGDGDRRPSAPELALCRPFLLRELELVRPQVILLVGGMAITAFLGPQRLEEIVGTYTERNGVYLLPLPHPSGVSRWLNEPSHQALVDRALAQLARWRATWEQEEDAGAGNAPTP